MGDPKLPEGWGQVPEGMPGHYEQEIEDAAYKRGLLEAAGMAEEEAARLRKKRADCGEDHDTGLLFSVKADTAQFLANILRSKASE